MLNFWPFSRDSEVILLAWLVGLPDGRSNLPNMRSLYTECRELPPRKIVTQCRNQARNVYDGAAFKIRNALAAE
jgi:hypothetical protein